MCGNIRNYIVPMEWHIVAGSCKPMFSGDKAFQLGIVQFNANHLLLGVYNFILNTIDIGIEFRGLRVFAINCLSAKFNTHEIFNIP